MLTIPAVLTKHTDYEPLAERTTRYGDDLDLASYDLTDDMLDAIVEACGKVDTRETRRTVRIVEAIRAARAGDVRKSVPSLGAFPEMLLAYLRSNLRDGWVYKRGADGHLHPWLVTKVEYNTGNTRNQERPSVTVNLLANGSRGGRSDKALGLNHSSLRFEGEQVTRKRVSDILTEANVYMETPGLREEYEEGLEHYSEVLAGGFTHQYRYTGKALETDNWRSDGEREHVKVIHDLAPSEVTAPARFAESVLFMAPEQTKGGKGSKRAAVVELEDVDEDAEFPGVGPVPTHFVLRIFCLATHEFLWVNAIDCERYVYDKTLGEKIVLPEDQRNLLDILTSNLDDFTGDVIEGKSAGNVILGKGEPGVGKTLTAEVYSELIERPLYSIHSGNLGVSADDVRKNLETAFKRAKRWNAVLLLDEADVFVLERGDNIVQNAIVAEFLRTLEYFTGLMFMTTNRANNIDDAILSRAAAIIDYALPDRDGIREVWKVQARNQSTTLPDDLLDALVDGFARISPRDVKMLLRLALRVSAGNNTPLDVGTFQRCAMFRGLHFAPGSRTA